VSFFERARDCIFKIVLRKIFAKPNDEVGIILFGSDETKNDLNSDKLGYQNIVEMDELKIASWDMLKKIKEIKQSQTNSCDFVSALLVGINYARNQTE
jgi:ATP-dependent DNA helicase 2 subunit 2